MRSIGILALVASLSACSFTMKGAPPNYQPEVHGEPDCTESKGRPALDTLGAIAGYGMAAFGVALAASGEEAMFFSPRAIGLGVAVSYTPIAAAYTAGAVSGTRKANRCREARREFEEWRRQELTPEQEARLGATGIEPRAGARPEAE